MKKQFLHRLVALLLVLSVSTRLCKIARAWEENQIDFSTTNQNSFDWGEISLFDFEEASFGSEGISSLIWGAGTTTITEAKPIDISTQNFNFNQIGRNESVALHTGVNNQIDIYSIDAYSFTEPLNIAIEGKTFGMRSLTPTQATPVVSVIFENPAIDGSWFGHSAIRIGNTVYDLEKIHLKLGHDIYRYRERDYYKDVLNDGQPQQGVELNFMVPDQIKQLETNLKQRVLLGGTFNYDLLNQECANVVEDEFARVGILFPNDFFEVPDKTLNQANILNQINKTPMTNWKEKSNLYSGFSSSGDLKRIFQRAGEFNKFSLVNKVGELPAVKSYLNNLGNEMDNLRAITPVGLIDAYFGTVDFDSASFTRGARGPSFRGIDEYLSKGPATFSAIDNLDFSTSFNSINIK